MSRSSWQRRQAVFPTKFVNGLARRGDAAGFSVGKSLADGIEGLRECLVALIRNLPLSERLAERGLDPTLDETLFDEALEGLEVVDAIGRMMDVPPEGFYQGRTSDVGRYQVRRPGRLNTRRPR
ncbi:hypothetical protein [Paludisphaera rhizosphaerae]|uniref:hypothetical protein n=1 Tax=Paludisphaera rhizosphaerae TaxID=2711216 RepID=UPI0013ECC56C|nr:hypothetical protein [Paludisphaera rhizosphaerae]